MNPALTVDDVAVTLGHTEVVHGVSTTVERGEWVALIGPNGAGKTTILRAVAGLLPFSGQVLFDGGSVASSSRREIARQIALVPQLPQTPPELTVAEYVLLGRTPHIGYLASETRADRLAAERAIARLTLRPFAARPLGSLSGGERQRAVLARALAQDAPILLLDEPTSALGVEQQEQVLDLIRRVSAEGIAVILISHQMPDVLAVCDRAVVLRLGALAATLSGASLTSENLIGYITGAIPGGDA